MFLAVSFLALLAAGILCSALGCVVPFAALSALAALCLPRRAALAVVGATWACNQAVGFLVKHYPRDSSTIAWGIGIGVAAFAAYGIAYVLRRNAVAVFLGAFAAYELGLMLFSTRLGGWDAYALHWMLPIFAANLAWFAGGYVALRIGHVFDLHPSR
jgi:hypothetical protein